MKDKSIYCEYCGGEIKRWNELIVIDEFLSFSPYPYHERCYAKNMKTIRGLFFGRPINTIINTFFTSLLVIVCLIFIVIELKLGGIGVSWVLILVTLLNIYSRLYSWIMYEKKL